MNELPSGLISILFTDIEDSTSLWDRSRDAMRTAHSLHNEILTSSFADGGGIVVKDKGDGFIVVFPRPANAIAAAASAQRRVQTTTWPAPLGELKVRMAVNTGLLEPENGDYYGPEVNKAARLEAAAHGGQILISDSTRSLTEGDLPHGLHLRDLGIQRLRGLSRPERIFELAGDGLPGGFPNLTTAADRGKPLPMFEDTFVGREAEIDALHALIARGARLVSVLGPGGIGKTRLAVETARGFEDTMTGGVHFADLAPLDSADDVGPAVAESLGVHAEGTVDVLALAAQRIDQPTMLIVDNFEHVIEASRSVGELLDGTSNLSIITTTRQPLGLRHESVFRLDPLTVASNGRPSAAVALFYDRAASQGVMIEEADRPIVASICRRLDGLPLAIELVAPRARLVSIRELDEMLGESLDAIGVGGSDLPERHRTIRNAIEWSLKNLSDSERQLFARLSALPAGATLSMLDRICCFDLAGSPLDNVATLVDNSLVNAMTDVPGGTRFRQLAPLREYGLELLHATDEYGPTLNRLIDYYVDMSPEWGLLIQSNSQVDAMLMADLPNMLTAMRWSLDAGRTNEMANVAKQLWVFWFKGDRIAPAVDWLALADKKLQSPVLDCLAGLLAFQQGDFETLAVRMARAQEAFEGEHDELGLALALTFGSVAVEDPEKAHAMLDRAGQLFASTAPVGEFLTFLFKSIVDFQIGDLEGSLRRREQARDRLGDLGMEEMDAWVQWNLAWSYYSLDRYAEAVEAFGEAYEYMAADGYQEGVASAAEGLALLDVKAGNLDRGIRMLGGAAATFERIGTVSWLEAGFHVTQTSESLRDEIGAARFDQLTAEGSQLTVQELTDLTGEALEDLRTTSF